MRVFSPNFSNLKLTRQISLILLSEAILFCVNSHINLHNFQFEKPLHAMHSSKVELQIELSKCAMKAQSLGKEQSSYQCFARVKQVAEQIIDSVSNSKQEETYEPNPKSLKGFGCGYGVSYARFYYYRESRRCCE